MGEKGKPDFGELVLVLGDIHIPYRVDDLPEQFKALLVPNKMQHVLCTGNLCSKQLLDHLKTIASSVHVAKGDFDDEEFPETITLKIGQFKIGVMHGHQVIPWGDPSALANVQREMDVDILITGHTHKTEVYQYGNRFMVNPGSATGAYSGFIADVVPSFILMAIKGDRLVTFVYQLKDGKVDVTKNEFQKA